jgi:hypothetical protein
MKRVVFLFAVVSLTSLLGCATPPPPPTASPEDIAAMQELNRESSQNPQPAPAKKAAKSRKSKP